jgi:hypothetical protein
MVVAYDFAEQQHVFSAHDQDTSGDVAVHSAGEYAFGSVLDDEIGFDDGIDGSAPSPSFPSPVVLVAVCVRQCELTIL